MRKLQQLKPFITEIEVSRQMDYHRESRNRSKYIWTFTNAAFQISGKKIKSFS